MRSLASLHNPEASPRLCQRRILTIKTPSFSGKTCVETHSRRRTVGRTGALSDCHYPGPVKLASAFRETKRQVGAMSVGLRCPLRSASSRSSPRRWRLPRASSGAHEQDGIPAPDVSMRQKLLEYVETVGPGAMESFAGEAPAVVVDAFRQSITNMLGTLPPQYFDVSIRYVY